MGDLTLADFRAELLAGLGNRTENTVITPARVVIGVNLAQQRIARSYDFSEMAKVAFGAMNYSGDAAVDKFLVPPPRLKTIHSFVLLDTSSGRSSLGQSKKVTERPWRQFDRRYPAPEWVPPGWPDEYARWGNVIVMVPPPQAQFTAQIRYTGYPTPFVAGADGQVSEFENKDDVLINYALAYFFKSLGRADRAAYLEGLAKEQLDEALDKDDTRPDIEVDGGTGNDPASGAYWQQAFVKSAP